MSLSNPRGIYDERLAHYRGSWTYADRKGAIGLKVDSFHVRTVLSSLTVLDSRSSMF